LERLQAEHNACKLAGSSVLSRPVEKCPSCAG
jgi:hypothetical protein